MAVTRRSYTVTYSILHFYSRFITIHCGTSITYTGKIQHSRTNRKMKPEILLDGRVIHRARASDRQRWTAMDIVLYTGGCGWLWWFWLGYRSGRVALVQTCQESCSCNKRMTATTKKAEYISFVFACRYPYPVRQKCSVQFRWQARTKRPDKQIYRIEPDRPEKRNTTSHSNKRLRNSIPQFAGTSMLSSRQPEIRMR